MPAVDVSPARRRALIDALSPRFGTDGARQFLRDVLADAGEADVPNDSAQFESFIRSELVPRLLPVCRFDEVERFTQRTLEKARPRPQLHLLKNPERPRVVVMDPDRERTRTLCRTLVRDGFDVEVVPDSAAVLRLQSFDVLVLRPDPGATSLLAVLTRRTPAVGVVIVEDASEKSFVRQTAATWPNDRLAVAPTEASATAIVARVRIVARD